MWRSILGFFMLGIFILDLFWVSNRSSDLERIDGVCLNQLGNFSFVGLPYMVLIQKIGVIVSLLVGGLDYSLSQELQFLTS